MEWRRVDMTRNESIFVERYRELEKAGHTNKEIAKVMNVPESYLRSELRRILGKWVTNKNG